MWLVHMWGTRRVLWSSFFFFNDTATTEIYTLSLHDALPISLTLKTVIYVRTLLLLDVLVQSEFKNIVSSSCNIALVIVFSLKEMTTSSQITRDPYNFFYIF